MTAATVQFLGRALAHFASLGVQVTRIPDDLRLSEDCARSSAQMDAPQTRRGAFPLQNEWGMSTTACPAGVPQRYNNHRTTVGGIGR